MLVNTETISFRTEGFCHLVDITAMTQERVRQSGMTQGLAVVFVPGSTGAVLTIEFEDGLVHDFEQLMERLVPRNMPYEHDRRWGDGNGFSHIRAALMGASAVVPVTTVIAQITSAEKLPREPAGAVPDERPALTPSLTSTIPPPTSAGTMASRPDRPRATPLARRLALEAGLDLSEVAGSGRKLWRQNGTGRARVGAARRRTA